MQKAIRALFIFLLVFCPLAFGTTEPWSLLVMQSVCFFCTLLYLFDHLQNRKLLYSTPGLIPLSVILAYILFQLIPLPPALLEFVSPSTLKTYQDTIGILDSDVWLPISIDRKATLQELFRYVCYFAFYFLTVQLLSSKERLQQMVVLIITFLTCLSVFSLIQAFSSTDKLFWIFEVSKNSRISGPYVNYNHYAGLMGMVLPITVSLFIYLKPKTFYKQTWREKIVDMFDFQGASVHLLLGFCSVLIACSIVLSLSRGGIISASLALLILIFLLTSRIRHKQKGLLIILSLVVVIIFSVSWFGWEAVFERFSRLRNHQGELYEARLEFWKDSIPIIKAFPFVGVGYGNFSEIYPLYRTFIHSKAVLHAHNDYIEFFVEGGMVGLLLFFWFMAKVFFNSFRTYWNRHERYSIYLFLGCIGGIVSISIHSMTDFNLHIGANGLYFFFAIGLMVSAANTKLRAHPKSTLLRKMRGRKVSTVLAGVMAVLLTTSILFGVRSIVGQIYYSSVKDIRLNKQISRPTLEKVSKVVDSAISVDPMEGRYYFAKANVSSLLMNVPQALNSYKQSVILKPLDGEILQRVGFIYSWLGNDSKAEKLLQAGIKSDISNPERYNNYADWLIEQNRASESLEYIREALLLEPSLTTQKTRRYIASMLINDIDEEIMVKAIPQKTEPLLGVAAYFVSNKEPDKAEVYYKKALNCADKGDEINVWSYYKVLRFYLNQKKLNDALDVALRSSKKNPGSPIPRIWSADIYNRLGVTYRAIEEYKMALTIDPLNKKATRELKKLVD